MYKASLELRASVFPSQLLLVLALLLFWHLRALSKDRLFHLPSSRWAPWPNTSTGLSRTRDDRQGLCARSINDKHI